MADEIEVIERAALEDINTAADAGLRSELKIASATVGTAYCSIAGALPASAIVMNRSIGVGVDGVETRDTIEEIVARYRDAGTARYFVHVHPSAQPEALAQWLTEFGLEQTRGWVKFRRGRELPPPVDTELEIRIATPADADAFARIECDAFDLGDAGIPWMARLIDRSNWQVYMSFVDGAPAGAGTMFIKDGVAWLDWGATAPEFRGRGSQTAILHRRIVDALDMGCYLLGTETGEEVPGDPQQSYKNIVRMGFEPAYVRPNFAVPKQNR